MGRRVSVVCFRPPLHYNARWAGRKQTDTQGENGTLGLHTHSYLFTDIIKTAAATTTTTTTLRDIQRGRDRASASSAEIMLTLEDLLQ